MAEHSHTLLRPPIACLAVESCKHDFFLLTPRGLTPTRLFNNERKRVGNFLRTCPIVHVLHGAERILQSAWTVEIAQICPLCDHTIAGCQFGLTFQEGSSRKELRGALRCAVFCCRFRALQVKFCIGYLDVRTSLPLNSSAQLTFVFLIVGEIH